MVHALEAGTIVAVMAGAIGWFMVLRRQTFAGHTLAVDRLPRRRRRRRWPALPLALGYFGACGLGGAGAGRGRPRRAAAARAASRRRSAPSRPSRLGLGFLFVGLYGGQLAGLESLLFGTFLGITAGQVRDAARGRRSPRWRSSPLIGRPLLFASVDGAVARAGGVPTRAARRRLPAAARPGGRGDRRDHRRAARLRPARDARRRPPSCSPPGPALGLALSVALAFAVTWLGLGIAYFSPYPVGFWVTSLSLRRSTSAVAASCAVPLGPPALLRGSAVGDRRRPDARPRVHAQRLPRRHLRRARLRARRLLRRAARQVFAGDALSHVAFTGALGAAAAGIDIRLGLFAATIVVGGGIGGCSATGPAPTTSSSAPSSPGSSGLGALFLSIFTSGSSGAERHRRRPRPLRLDPRPLRGPTPASPPRSRSLAALALAGDRPAAAVRLARPRGRARPRPAGAGPRHRLPR